MPPKQSQRPRMPHTSEAMKRWSALLAQELSEWPQVITKPMFGVLGVYRGKQIFAALPGNRAIHSSNSILLRFEKPTHDFLQRVASDPRMSHNAQDRFWFPFRIESDADLRDAIALLAEAYEAAKAPKPTKKASKPTKKRAKK